MTAPAQPKMQTDVTLLDRTRGRSRVLRVTVVVVAAALLGFGVWIVYEQATETATTVEIEAADWGISLDDPFSESTRSS